MTEIKKLIADIREYELNASYARKTNERELPALKAMLSDINRFEFSDSDQDLRQRLEVVAEKIKGMEVDTLTREFIDETKEEVRSILEQIVKRYRERMELYASRQNSY